MVFAQTLRNEIFRRSVLMSKSSTFSAHCPREKREKHVFSHGNGSCNTREPLRLLLSRSRFFRLGLGPLLPYAHQSRLAPCLPQCPVRILRAFRHVAPIHLADSLLAGDVRNRQRQTGLPRDLAFFGAFCDLLLGRIEFLVLAVAAGEEDQAGAVGFEALDVHGEGFGGEIGAARVNGDADRGG